jgi:hypothetical protein
MALHTKNSKPGQSTLEIAALVACVSIALSFMVNYMTQTFQGKIKESMDSIGTQYDPGEASSDFTTTRIATYESVLLSEVNTTMNWEPLIELDFLGLEFWKVYSRVSEVVRYDSTDETIYMDGTETIGPAPVGVLPAPPEMPSVEFD